MPECGTLVNADIGALVDYVTLTIPCLDSAATHWYGADSDFSTYSTVVRWSYPDFVTQDTVAELEIPSGYTPRPVFGVTFADGKIWWLRFSLDGMTGAYQFVLEGGPITSLPISTPTVLFTDDDATGTSSYGNPVGVGGDVYVGRYTPDPDHAGEYLGQLLRIDASTAAVTEVVSEPTYGATRLIDWISISPEADGRLWTVANPTGGGGSRAAHYDTGSDTLSVASSAIVSGQDFTSTTGLPKFGTPSGTYVLADKSTLGADLDQTREIHPDFTSAVLSCTGPVYYPGHGFDTLYVAPTPTVDKVAWLRTGGEIWEIGAVAAGGWAVGMIRMNS